MLVSWVCAVIVAWAFGFKKKKPRNFVIAMGVRYYNAGPQQKLPRLELTCES